MNFLNPLYLFALAAVAVPILIHIFSRRRVPEVPFSTIRFLSRSDRRSMMRINVRRLLLLLLRILAVALVALAFARPVMRGSLAALFPAGGSRAACILLDRSFSMGAEGDGGVVFDRGLARLAAILDNLERGDAVSVVLFDTGSEIVYEGEIEKEAVLEALRDARPSWGGTDLRGAAALGERMLAGSRRDVRELYVISDFQKTALARAGAAGRGETGEPESPDRGDAGMRATRGKPRAALPVRAFLLPVQANVAANVAVESIVAPSVALHKGETAELGIVLRNRSRELAAKFPLEVSISGRRIMEKEIEILPDNYCTETVVFPVERAGWIEGVVKKRSDRLPADDTRYFTLNVRDRTRVLLLADEGGFYLEQALGPGGIEGDIAVTKRGWRAFTSADLGAADVVVLGPGRGPAQGDVEIIGRFVERGGTAIVLLVPELKAAAERLSRYPLGFEFAEMPQGFFRLSKPAVAPGF
ncbi:MAG: BatA domain-containing protein, partial [Candidatus Krumholzibacteria bacterium]|nr:BatA domain-containing protein [Candidatus Krumholzibacteria bacterium]